MADWETTFEMIDHSMRRAALAAALSNLNRRDGEWLVATEHDDFAACIADSSAMAALATFAVPQTDAFLASVPRDLRAVLQGAVEAAQMELERRGFDPVDPGEGADLRLFAIATRCDKTSEHWGCVGGLWLDPSGWHWDPCLWFADSNLAFPAGTLLVGVADAAGKQLAFAGVAPRFFDRSGEMSARVDRTVARIFSDFPHRARTPHVPLEKHASSSSNESNWGAHDHESTMHQGNHFGGAHGGHLATVEQRRGSARRLPVADGLGA